MRRPAEASHSGRHRRVEMTPQSDAPSPEKGGEARASLNNIYFRSITRYGAFPARADAIFILRFSFAFAKREERSIYRGHWGRARLRTANYFSSSFAEDDFLERDQRRATKVAHAISSQPPTRPTEAWLMPEGRAGAYGPAVNAAFGQYTTPRPH